MSPVVSAWRAGAGDRCGQRGQQFTRPGIGWLAELPPPGELQAPGPGIEGLVTEAPGPGQHGQVLVVLG